MDSFKKQDILELTKYGLDTTNTLGRCSFSVSRQVARVNAAGSLSMSSYINVFFELDYVTFGGVVEMGSNVGCGNRCNEWDSQHQGQKGILDSAHRGLDSKNFEIDIAGKTMVETNA